MRFDPSTMSETTSPTVRALRTFVERTMEDEIDRVSSDYGTDTAALVETSLRSVVYSIFHHNPAVHTRVKDDPSAFDPAVQTLFGIDSEGN